MLKIVTHQALQRAVLVTIFHPLSLDCRMEILREIEAGASKPGTLTEDKNTSSAAAAGTEETGEAAASTREREEREDKRTENLAKIPLTSNVIKQAWDRLQLGENQKISLLMIYIENILLERIVPTAVDDSPGNENIVQHEVDEDYLSASCAAITPLRTISDPKTDAISLLHAVYVLPPREFCEAFCSSAAVSRALNGCSGQTTPIPKNSAASGSTGSVSSALDGRADGAHDAVWSSEIQVEHTGDSDGIASLTIDCDAEANAAAPAGAGAGAAGDVTAATESAAAEVEVTDTDGSTASRVKVTFEATHDGMPGSASTVIPHTAVTTAGDASKSQSQEKDKDNDGYSSPVRQNKANKRTKMGRNDMLLPAESKMGVGLNSADQLVLPTLQKLDDWMDEKLPFYPEVRVAYSMETVFGILNQAHAFSITTVQVRI